MAITCIKFLVILRYHFNLDLKVTEDACRIWKLEGKKTKSSCSTQNWFDNFLGGSLLLEVNPRIGQPSIVAKKCKVKKEPDHQY